MDQTDRYGYFAVPRPLVIDEVEGYTSKWHQGADGVVTPIAEFPEDVTEDQLYQASYLDQLLEDVAPDEPADDAHLENEDEEDEDR